MTQVSKLPKAASINDSRVSGPGSGHARFEVHLTTGPIATQDLPAFEELARQLDTRALLIQLPEGQYPLQPMLSFEHEGELGVALAHAGEVAAKAERMGYPICRCKIECQAEADASVHAAGHYLEWHGRIAVAGTELAALAARCRQHGAHLSNNALKGNAARYVTMREPSSLPRLRERVTMLCSELETRAWRFDKQQWECVMFDSNLPLDAGWLEA